MWSLATTVFHSSFPSNHPLHKNKCTSITLGGRGLQCVLMCFTEWFAVHKSGDRNYRFDQQQMGLRYMIEYITNEENINSITRSNPTEVASHHEKTLNDTFAKGFLNSLLI